MKIKDERNLTLKEIDETRALIYQTCKNFVDEITTKYVENDIQTVREVKDNERLYI